VIKNIEKVADYLMEWICDQAEVAHATSAVVGISGGVDSATVFGLCTYAMPLTIGVMMPCHSSPETVERGFEVVRAFPGDGEHQVRHKVVNLEAAFGSIRSQVVDLTVFDTPLDEARRKEGSLRSCLRAPTLDFVAKLWNGLVYGTGNRDEDEIFRYYNKRGDGAVDSNVLGCLHKSEVYQLAKYIGVPQSVIDAVPTADLWGPNSGQADEKEMGITYDEIEWVTRFVGGSADKLRTFRGENEPGLTERQLLVLAKAQAAELATRHKAEPPPQPRRDALVWRGWLD
jgi:NAD+ synthase